MQELKTVRTATGAETKMLRRGVTAERRELRSLTEMRELAEDMLETSKRVEVALRQAREDQE